MNQEESRIKLNSVVGSLQKAQSELVEVFHSLAPKGPIRWVNVWRKGTLPEVYEYHAGNFLYPTELAAKNGRSSRLGANKNIFLGAFPVDFSSRESIFQLPELEAKPHVLADMDRVQQKAVKDAAFAYYTLYAMRNKINTIKFIRTLFPGSGLAEAKFLVDYAIGVGPKPEWFKAFPYSVE